MNTPFTHTGEYSPCFGVVGYDGYAYFGMEKLPVRLRNIGQDSVETTSQNLTCKSHAGEVFFGKEESK